jgi:hypothetical protein
MTPSRVDPEAKITVFGLVVDAEGRPVEGARVSVNASGDLSDFIPFACLVGCSLDEDTETGDDGRFEVEFTGRDSQTPLGGARQLAATVADTGPLPPGAVGAGSVAALFRVQTEQVGLPDLLVWRPTIWVHGTGQTRALTVFPEPPLGREMRLTIRDAQGNPLAPEQKVGHTDKIDARLIEDFDVRVDITASGDSGGARVVHSSPVFAFRDAGAGPPPSRGATCRRYDEKGRLRTFDPCPVTDGNLLTLAPPVAADCADVPPDQHSTCLTAAERLELDLGERRPLRLVVVRGTRFGTLTVSTSNDGRTWSDPVPRDVRPGELVATVRPPAGRARYVRVTGAGNASEVSVW